MHYMSEIACCCTGTALAHGASKLELTNLFLKPIAVQSRVCYSMTTLQMAVEREDYELAKQIKMDADRLRATGEAAAGAPVPQPARSGPHPDEIFKRVLQPSVSHVSPGATCKLDTPEEYQAGKLHRACVMC